MEIVLKLRTEIAEELHKGQATLPATQRLGKVADEFGVTLQPQHAGVEDAQLATYFTVMAPDKEATAITQRLGACDGVEGAYTKPAGEPP